MEGHHRAHHSVQSRNGLQSLPFTPRRTKLRWCDEALLVHAQLWTKGLRDLIVENRRPGNCGVACGEA